jgi:hypothetical protein
MDWNQGLSWWQAIMPHSLPWITSEIVSVAATPIG